MKMNVRCVADEQVCTAPWGGRKGGRKGEHFRCYLCGHRFVVGEGYRLVMGNGKRTADGLACRNLITCDACDGADVVDRFAKMVDEARTRFWWLWADAYESD